MTTQWYTGQGGRFHCQDPHLPGPTHDWVLDPWGWTIHSRCGLVLRGMQPTSEDGTLCTMCAGKLLQERR
ncbi:hypothetical protein GCM10029976_090340 [Kribbella albertanoniae]|uniref:Uncharacterized protein n=1 Tax=Kribbella albertanoniae TaxID=1266829 RepID=A0A4R4PKJ5_9ACTN|nr:hypothetical protein [Kribbella albertanoniae]TDC22483.1 hypothetical protein E1261_30705 [Kribbella albertanoniae]